MRFPLRGIATVVFAGALAVGCVFAGRSGCPSWPLWEAYSATFVQADGRVIDFATQSNHSTSEGQGYALFFALVANDRARFERLLTWTQNNLAGGNLAARLPAWQWGRRSDGTWGVLDTNSASDADLWIAYSLIQAGRLWQEPRFRALGISVLNNVRTQEVVELSGLGPMLLPGAQGFKHGNNAARLNPSYLPIQILRAFAAEDRGPLWRSIAENTVRLIQGASPRGIVPDWVIFNPVHGFDLDPAEGGGGSFDAIRVYLWAGMLNPSDQLARPLLRALGGMRGYLMPGGSAPPLRVDSRTGSAEGAGPVGFSAALVPYLTALDDTRAAEDQRLRATTNTAGRLIGTEPRYYDQVLAMFGLGWFERRFRFGASGQLVPNWEIQCLSRQRSLG